MTRARALGTFAAALSLLLAAAVVGPPLAVAQNVATGTASTGECPRKNGSVVEAPALKAPITLTPASGKTQGLVNFGTSRSPKTATFIFVADKPLPASVGPDNLELIADPMLRSGDTLETTTFKRPTFSQPVFGKNRTRIEFDVCLNPAGVDPGKYTTVVTLGGPTGVNSATAGLTANLKAGTWFWIVLGIAMILTGLLLFAKESKRAGPKPTWWWLSPAALILGAAVAMWKVWDADPSWGANPGAAAVALVAAGLSAIGAQSIVNLFRD